MTKFVLPTLFCVVLCVGGFTRPAAALRGDTDCNGKTTDADLPAAIAALFEHGPCADADVDGNGVKSASDVTAELALLYGPSRASAFDQVLREIMPDGSITLDTARQLFQLAYGGLDDVTVPSGAPGGIVDGTIALRAMLQHRDDLFGADAARLDQVLNENGPVSVTIEPGSTPSTSPSRAVHDAVGVAADDSLPPPLPKDDAHVQDFTDRLTVWLPQIADAAQVLFTLPVDIAGYAVPDVKAVADTLAFDASGAAQGGTPARCRIRFFQGYIDEAPAERDNTVAHEMWHCFEALIINNVDTFNREPDWIIEGQAEYVAVYLTKTQSPAFEPYLAEPALPLFSRGYSAVGLYVTMASDGAAVFAALKAMLVSGAQSSLAAFDTALSATPRLLETWGEMEFEEPLFAGDWNYSVTTGMPPPPDDDIPGVVHLDVGDGASQLMTANAHSVLLWKINLTTDFIHFHIPSGTSGVARLLDAAGREYNDLTDVWLCQHPNPDQCKCPQGSEGEAPESQPVLSPMEVAASAGDGGVYGALTGISLDEICKQKQPPAPPSAFCADARNLQAAINQFTLDLDPATLQTELETDVFWLGLMAQDAPADITAAMTSVAAAYVTANTDFASIGYEILPMSEQDELTIQAALAAVAAVAPQSQQVGAYVAKVCGFSFHLPGV